MRIRLCSRDNGHLFALVRLPYSLILMTRRLQRILFVHAGSDPSSSISLERTEHQWAPFLSSMHPQVVPCAQYVSVLQEISDRMQYSRPLPKRKRTFIHVFVFVFGIRVSRRRLQGRLARVHLQSIERRERVLLLTLFDLRILRRCCSISHVDRKVRTLKSITNIEERHSNTPLTFHTHTHPS